MDYCIGTLGLNHSQEMPFCGGEKTEGSSINFAEKVVLVDNTLASTPRKAS